MCVSLFHCVLCLSVVTHVPTVVLGGLNVLFRRVLRILQYILCCSRSIGRERRCARWALARVKISFTNAVRSGSFVRDSSKLKQCTELLIFPMKRGTNTYEPTHRNLFPLFSRVTNKRTRGKMAKCRDARRPNN